jgi:hypothetical protein
VLRFESAPRLGLTAGKTVLADCPLPCARYGRPQRQSYAKGRSESGSNHRSGAACR